MGVGTIIALMIHTHKVLFLGISVTMWLFLDDAHDASEDLQGALV